MAESYVIAIDGDEQYRTENRQHAKLFYEMVDQTFEREVDGRTKQLIYVEENGWDSQVLLHAVIKCPADKEEEDYDYDMEEQEQHSRHRGRHL